MKYILRNALVVAGLAITTQAVAQVTFYEREGFQGRSFTTERQVGNFERFGFNDRASSVVVVGERWEICQDAGFSGRCADASFIPIGEDPGGSCTLDTDCKSGLCDTVLLHGVCTTLCMNGTCPPDTGTKCVSYQSGFDFGVCLQQCALDTECPQGQTCTVTPNDPPGFCSR